MKKYILTAFVASILVIISFSAQAMMPTTDNETLIGQVMFPLQTDYQTLLPVHQKSELFQGQTGLCGLFALYNGYSLMHKIKPIAIQPSLTQKLTNFFMQGIPHEHLDYFKKFEDFFSQNQSLEIIELDRPNRLGYLNLLHLEKIIAAHPEYKKNKDNVFVTALSFIQSCNQETWPITSRTSKKVLQEAYRFRANPYKPLLVILCMNTHPDKKQHHWITLLFTKDVTWIADSCNHQDNMLIHSPDIHFVNTFFRTMPLPLPPVDEILAVEQEINVNPNFSQELLECFAAEPGTVFSKPRTCQA